MESPTYLPDEPQSSSHREAQLVPCWPIPVASSAYSHLRRQHARPALSPLIPLPMLLSLLLRALLSPPCLDRLQRWLAASAHVWVFLPSQSLSVTPRHRQLPLPILLPHHVELISFLPDLMRLLVDIRKLELYEPAGRAIIDRGGTIWYYYKRYLKLGGVPGPWLITTRPSTG
jgi:hypothetical protein